MSGSRWALRIMEAGVGAGIGLAAFAWQSERSSEFLLRDEIRVRQESVEAIPPSRSAPADSPTIRGAFSAGLLVPADRGDGAVFDPPQAARPGSRMGDYGLRGNLRVALERYRSARDEEGRSAPLTILALSDRPEVFRFLIDELHAVRAEGRSAVVEALIQYGDRDAIPKLRELAEDSSDSGERQRLIEAADYLALPTYTELYGDRPKPAALTENP